MNKQEFLDQLQKGLGGLPQEDIDGRLAFYGEMIDDRVEEGMTEEDAVADVGAVEDIISQIVAEYPLARLVKQKVKPRRALAWWEIVLLILGSPVWLSLLIGAVIVVISVYVTLWSLVISLWAVGASLVGGLVGGVASAIVVALGGNTLGGIALLGAGLACAGLAIFMFFLCREAIKGFVALTKRIVLEIKKSVMGRRHEA